MTSNTVTAVSAGEIIVHWINETPLSGVTLCLTSNGIYFLAFDKKTHRLHTMLRCPRGFTRNKFATPKRFHTSCEFDFRCNHTGGFVTPYGGSMPLEGHRDKPVVEELWRAAPTRAPFGPAAAQTTAMLFIQLL